MSIEKIGTRVQESLTSSSIDKAIGYLPNARTVAKAVGTMAIATVALEAMSQMTVSAGPVTYGLCVAACAFSAPPALPFCLAACGIAAGPWCI